MTFFIPPWVLWTGAGAAVLAVLALAALGLVFLYSRPWTWFSR